MPAELPLDLLFRLLPPTAELTAVREAVFAAAMVDSSRRWAGSAPYRTLDRRVVSPEALDAAFRRAESRSIEQLRTLHGTLREAVLALAEGDRDRCLEGLVQLGETASRAARWTESLMIFAIVEAFAGETGHTAASILAARRIGRAHLHLGDVARATDAYGRSRAAAEAAGDRVGRIIAHTGLGHALSVQGRWREAEAEYRAGFDLTADGDDELRGQLGINLALTARELGRLDEAALRLELARAAWDALSPGDRSAWHNNRGLLLVAQHRHTEAEAEFRRALDSAGSDFDRAMILDNMAGLHLEAGALHEAEAYARRAEDHAIAGASPRALAEVYLRLGRIMAARRDPNGVAFFEKALELARENRYPLTEAMACLEYARFRQAHGDSEEAAGLRDAAAAIFARLGTDPLPADIAPGPGS